MTEPTSRSEASTGDSPQEPEDGRSGPAALTAFELGRWAWRQLTSMRTALLLLFMLAIAAIPGSIIPQTGVDPLAVTRWKALHPDLTRVYTRLDLFNVYGSVWFSAIYILLVTSLVGCILPRLAVYWRAVRSQPPQSPARLNRLPAHRVVDAWPRDTAATLADAAALLRKRRYRVRVDGHTISAERGYLREAGNLLFHASVLIVLVGFAYGKMFGFTGGVIVSQGDTFTNTLSEYDDIVPGSLFKPETDLNAFGLTINRFTAHYLPSGQPTSFDARVSYRTAGANAVGSAESSRPTTTTDLRVNHPVSVAGTDVFLVGHGYSPVVTVRDGSGQVAYQGPSVFLPQDGSFQSFGVIKIPDAQPRQLGFEGDFFPTYASAPTGPVSIYPGLANPTLSLRAYAGNLGLDSGKPQSVYVLPKTRLTRLANKAGEPLTLKLSPGQTVRLPDGNGTITFDGVKPWVKLQVSQSPGDPIALGGISLALMGLLGSLFVRPRRLWVRPVPGSDSLIEIGALARGNTGTLDDHIDQLVQALDLSPERGTAPTHERAPV